MNGTGKAQFRLTTVVFVNGHSVIYCGISHEQESHRPVRGNLISLQT